MCNPHRFVSHICALDFTDVFILEIKCYKKYGQNYLREFSYSAAIFPRISRTRVSTTKRDVKTLPQPLHILFSNSSLMCRGARRTGERRERCFRRNGFYEPRPRYTEPLEPSRVNGSLNSTGNAQKAPSGKIREIRFTVSREAPFPSEGTGRVNRSPEPVTK